MAPLKDILPQGDAKNPPKAMIIKRYEAISLEGIRGSEFGTRGEKKNGISGAGMLRVISLHAYYQHHKDDHKNRRQSPQ